MYWTESEDNKKKVNYDLPPWEKNSTVKPIKPSVYEFKELTPEQIKECFKKDHENWKLEDTKHPAFSDEGVLKSTETLAEYFSALGDTSWEKKFKKCQAFWERLEDRVEDLCNSDILVLSGLATKGEVSDTSVSRPDKEILKYVETSGEFPCNFELSWMDERLCVNEVPTQIREEDVRDAYNGLQALTSKGEAMTYVGDLIKNKLKVLFGKD